MLKCRKGGIVRSVTSGHKCNSAKLRGARGWGCRGLLSSERRWGPLSRKPSREPNYCYTARMLDYHPQDCICRQGGTKHRYTDQWGDVWHSATFESLEENYRYALRWSGNDPRYAAAIVNLLQ